ncbi:MAG: LysR family transcriptional regulator [Pseudomonadota bacterium]
MVELKQIRSFLCVFDLGSFSRAARFLNIAQPALSVHVRKLEDRLGVVLLERTPRGVIATEAGRRFARRARQILDLADETEKEFRATPGTITGDVKLGLPGSVCPVLAPPLILAARERYPGVRLIVSEFMSGDLADMLRDGRIDLAVLFNVEPSDDFTSDYLLTEHLHLVGQADDPSLPEGLISALDLAQYPLVVTRPPHGLRVLLDRWAGDAGVALSIRYEVDAPSVMVQMVTEGLCYSILSPSAIREKRETGLLSSAKVVAPSIERKVCLCESRRMQPEKARSAIRDLTRNVALELAADQTWENEASG